MSLKKKPRREQSSVKEQLKIPKLVHQVEEKNWDENNNHGLPSTSEAQSVTDYDIAMPIRYTLLDNGFTLEAPSEGNIKENPDGKRGVLAAGCDNWKNSFVLA
ncbi:hypothetical protein TNIN_307151 [Trichonephila inaurata madagascariensis]|uniref:Uncharacterized protein n=1 Tax=Trichonephila inaurata madagascariensis TaxID=2747483 RepID=A0A8X6IQN2_9ARAC|nr:hypothetical protein TNIN_307151 [Trichonephila inaurata madagascariensis]